MNANAYTIEHAAKFFASVGINTKQLKDRNGKINQLQIRRRKADIHPVHTFKVSPSRPTIPRSEVATAISKLKKVSTND